MFECLSEHVTACIRALTHNASAFRSADPPSTLLCVCARACVYMCVCTCACEICVCDYSLCGRDREVKRGMKDRKEGDSKRIN